MTHTDLPSTFSSTDTAGAIVAAVLVEVALIGMLSMAGSGGVLSGQNEPPPPVIPIQITPVLDDAPLLKLGSKKKAKLPDMWKKPKPKPRFEDKAAPAVDAKKEIDELPKNEVAKSKEKPAPADVKEEDLAKKVDTPDIEEDDKPTTAPEGEGAEDGVAEGTETDPLKAIVLSQYRVKVIAWFRAGFVRPADQIDEETLKTLSALAVNVVGSDGTFLSYTLSSSGNPVFDARVRATLDRKIGQKLPPPPPKYPELLTPIVNARFSGKK